MVTQIFTTKRFNIRAFKESDLKVFTRYRANKSVAKYQTWQDFSYDDALRLFRNMDYSQFGQHDKWFQLAVVEKQTDQLMGDLAVHFIDNEQVEVGFTVAPENHRKGIAYESLNGLIEYLFTQRDIKKVVAFVDVRNVASYRLLEKADFARTRHIKAYKSPYVEWKEQYFYTIHSFNKN